MTFNEAALERVRVAREMLMRQAFERAGANNELTVANWEAPTQIGRFDASYDPALGEYNVTIKCFFEFVDPVGGPQDNQIAWDHASRQQYIQDTLRVVRHHWSDRYLLKCTKPGWRHYRAKVLVQAINHPVRASAHFTLEAKRRPDNGSSYGGGVNWGLNPPKIDVDSKGVVPKYTQNQQKQIFEMRERMLKEAIKVHNVRVIPFTSGTSTVGATERNRIIAFANHIARFISDDVVGIRLYVYGSTSGFDTHGRAATRAARVADLIRNQLGAHRGCVHTLTSLTKGKKAEALKQIRDHNNNQAITSTSVAGAVIFVHTPHTVAREAITNYLVMVHEFGHVLGLPDEYMGSHHPRVTATLPLNSIIPLTLAQDMQVTKDEDRQRIIRQQVGMVDMKDAVGATVPLPHFVSSYSGQTPQSDQTEDRLAGDAYYNLRDAKKARWGANSWRYKKWVRDNPGPPPGHPGLGSSSIMYGGMDIMPAHYLTIWSSLCQATSRFLSPADWTILESPRNPDGARWFNP